MNPTAESLTFKFIKKVKSPDNVQR